MLKSLGFIVFLVMIFQAKGQQRINLYPEGVPNTIKNISLERNEPEFYFYKPIEQTKTKVFLIIPGGGYAVVAMNHEGHDVAKRLKNLGYASFVLRYRLPIDSQMVNKSIAPIQDAQTAMKYIRENALQLGINEREIVVMGFSAGGHLASTLSTHLETSYIGDIDLSLIRPDYSILVYPVITMQEGITHLGSKNNLLGPDVKEVDIITFSNELNINRNTPPAYLVHANDDKAVPVKNALLYKEGLDANGISNKLFRYDKGGHGFGMYNKQQDGDWFLDMLDWLTKK